MVEFRLTEQQRMLRELARRFVREEAMPVRAQLDQEPDPRNAFSWELLRKADALGLRTLGLPEEYGGIGADTVTKCVLDEELAAGDLGFAVVLDQTWRVSKLLTRLCNEEQQARFLPSVRDDPECVLAPAITEAVG